MIPNPDRCPKCGQLTVNKASRQCIRCKGGWIFRPGDDCKPAGELEPFFLFVVKGPRGTGFYRRPFLEQHLKNW